MSKMKWDETGDRLYEVGTDRFALYLQAANGTYPSGVPWNGIRTFNDNPEGGDATDLYADNIKYLSIRGTVKFNFSLGAYTYPDEFALCDGSAVPVTGVKFGQQKRRAFGLAGRTLIGNDVDFEDHGYNLHLVYGATAGVSSKEYQTVNESPEAIEFSWDCETTPIQVEGFKPVAHIVIDSTKANASVLAELEAILYGTDGYMVYSEVDSPTPDSYDAATPVGTENPNTEGWYERDGIEGHYTYTLTQDTTVDAQKTYYIKTVGDNPKGEGWYEKDSNNAYFLSEDTSVDESKTYYEGTETGGTTGRLPLPDEVLRMFGYTAS